MSHNISQDGIMNGISFRGASDVLGSYLERTLVDYVFQFLLVICLNPKWEFFTIFVGMGIEKEVLWVQVCVWVCVCVYFMCVHVHAHMSTLIHLSKMNLRDHFSGPTRFRWFALLIVIVVCFWRKVNISLARNSPRRLGCLASENADMSDSEQATTNS